MILLDSIPPIQKLVVALSAIIVLLLLLAMVRIINSGDNDLQWWHLVSTKAADGGQYADWNRIGQGLGVVLCVWLPAVYVYSPKMEAVGLAAVMGVALLYLGGVSSYAATLRSKRGSVETTVQTESTPSKVVTETTLQTPPVT